MCGARTTSIPSQRTCVVDRENLRHLASVRLTCMDMERKNEHLEDMEMRVSRPTTKFVDFKFGQNNVHGKI